MPLISICVAAYNLEKYIGQCIDRLVNQEFENYEIVIVDNGSEDKTIEICEEYAKKCDKIRFYKLPKPTITVRAHIFAVEQAKGEYIHLIDGDDYVAAGYLKHMDKIIGDKSPDLIMGTFNCIIEPGATNFYDVPIDANRINNVCMTDAVDYIFSLPHFNRYVWRFVVKRYLFDLVKFEPHISHLINVDNLKSTIWLLNAQSIYYYDGPFYYYRRRLGSTVLSKNNPMTIDFIKAIIAIAEVLNKIPQGTKRRRGYVLEAPQIEWFIKLFISGYDSITYLDLYQLSMYIDQHKDSLYLLKHFALMEVETLLNLIEKYGSFQGLAIYCELDKAGLYHLVHNQKENAIYIFPTGKFGENTCRLLQGWGFNIVGFFDNDVLKKNHCFSERPCFLPDQLLTFSEKKKEKTIIIISTIYKQLIPEFCKQLLEAGVDEKNILVRE